MTIVALVGSIAALVCILVALPGLYSYSYERNRAVAIVTRTLLTVAVLATVVVCILAVL